MLRRSLACLLAAIPLAAGAQNLSSQLSQKTVLNLNVVRQIAAAPEPQARKNNWSVSIAIVDDAGRLMYFSRMDDTPNSSVDVSLGKARHAVNFRRDTKFHQDLLEKGLTVVLGLPDSTPIEGGLRLIANGKVIGGIGVSGVQASQDAQIARAGVALLGE